MLLFSTQRFASFSCRAEFSQLPYANISFLDSKQRRILFHLSLRYEDGIAACNCRQTGIDSWEHETRRRLRLRPGDNQIKIRFDAPQIQVFVNGQKIFSFGTLFGRRKFPDLDHIAFVDYQGGIQASTIDMAHRLSNETVLTLTPRLALRGWLRHPHDPNGLHLQIGGVDLPPPLIVTSGPSGSGLRATLPGRVWQAAAPDEPLELQLFENDTLLLTQHLHRADLLKDIRGALEAGALDGDPVLATQIIEHVRFADIGQDLDPQHRMQLLRLADNLGLSAFLDLPKAATTTPDVTAPAKATPEASLPRALARVARQLHDDPDGAFLPAELDAARKLPAEMQSLFYIALAEPFCQRDRFDHLYAEAVQRIDVSTLTPGDNLWFNSGLLPYLLRSGRIKALRKLLWQLTEITDQWVMTPPLAWVTRAALTDPTLTDEARANVVYAFLAFLNRRAADYWQRSPCLQMVTTTVTLIGAELRLDRYLQAELETVALRCYGLSADFWDQISERKISLRPRLAAAQMAFATLRDPDQSDRAKADALTLFEHADCADCARVRRDLFGPSGQPGPAAPTLQTLLQNGQEAREAALRHMAAPDAEPVTDPTVHSLMVTAIPDLGNQVDRSPHYALQKTVGRQAASLLLQASGGADPVPECEALLPNLDILADARVQWIGPGVALALLNGLLDTGATHTTNNLTEWLQQALNTRKAGALALHQIPALAMPLMALQRRATAGLAAAQDMLDQLGLADQAGDTPPPPLHPAHFGQVNPLFDTVVVIFSCRPNLETRIPQMRAGWLSRLAELGVPYVIVTGDGDGTLDGDILHLDAPDDYEGLPQKTLATIRWVHDQTGFAHMLKVDDDCFLNPEEFFLSLSFRKFDYYGRSMTRVPGQMDRAWHCAKSTSDRGRLEFDKSPEPSSYCDGGSGYTLSRRAMTELLDAASGAVGQELIHASFMEDKLVGDLLALNGIAPANEDYYISVRRRATPGGIAVSRWVNGFDASQISPAKLVHLDDPAAQARANRHLASSTLFPKKIWPSYQPAKLGEQTNALDMVTDASRLSSAREAPVALVAAMRNEMFMLPHFLDHYRRLGVESFLIADNCSNDGTLEYLADQPDVALFSVDTDYNKSQYGVAWQQALMAHFRPDRWSLIADADELLTWQLPQQETLPDLLQRPEFDRATGVRIFMLDMYPQGALDQATFTSGDLFAEAGFTDREPFLHNSFGHGPYSNAPTWTSALRHRLIPGSRNELFVAQKIALLKYSPFMRLSAGLHYVAGARLASQELLFGHFKYNADFHRKAQAEVARRQHFNNAEEYRKYLALASEGRDRIFDPDLSVPWFETDFVKARLK